MRRTRILLAMSLAALVGCSNSGVAEYRASSGSLAISHDGKELYAVDSDNDLVAVLDASSMRKLAEVKVGKRPQRIAVGKDGTLYVTNKMERSVSAIRRGSWKEIGRVVVGVEPVGIDVTPDGRRVLVASSTSLTDALTGTLTSLDARSLEIEWSVDVGPEAYAVRAVPGKKAYVSLFKSGKLAVVDLEKRQVTGHVDLAGREAVDLFGSSLRPPQQDDENARVAGAPNLVTDIGLSPDGERVYVPHIRARDGEVIEQRPGGGYGGGPQSGTCGRGAIVAAALSTVVVDDDAPKVDDFTECRFGNSHAYDRSDFPPNILDPNPTGADPVQGPETVLVDPNGEYLYVANFFTNNVLVLATNRRTGPNLMGNTGIAQVIRTGSAPSGLAISPDGKTLYVHHQFDHSVGVYRPGDDGRIAEVSHLRQRYADDVLPPNVVAGRRLFFAADDPVMSNSANPISCGSCHPHGREDGRVWPFPEGPRQTPGLAGRRLGETAPYHWAGEFATMYELLESSVVDRMGGTGFAGPDDPGAESLMDFMVALEAPDNPHRDGEPSERARRGKEIFERADCGACHQGDSLTDGRNHDVGSLVTSGSGRPVDLTTELNTPSLLGLARSWPYLHDGSAVTLRDRMLHDKETNKHGLTRDLTSQDIDDLVEYLKTL